MDKYRFIPLLLLSAVLLGCGKENGRTADEAQQPWRPGFSLTDAGWEGDVLYASLFDEGGKTLVFNALCPRNAEGKYILPDEAQADDRMWFYVSSVRQSRYEDFIAVNASIYDDPVCGAYHGKGNEDFSLSVNPVFSKFSAVSVEPAEGYVLYGVNVALAAKTRGVWSFADSGWYSTMSGSEGVIFSSDYATAKQSVLTEFLLVPAAYELNVSWKEEHGGLTNDRSGTIPLTLLAGQSVDLSLVLGESVEDMKAVYGVYFQ